MSQSNPPFEAAYDFTFDAVDHHLPDYLESAELIVDNQFGEGYAEQHPELWAGAVVAAALIHQGERILIAVEAIRDTVARSPAAESGGASQ